MGSRTTTVCDGAECTCEHDNPVTRGSAMPQGFYPGWSTLHTTDEKTKLTATYDLCPACTEKIVSLLGLKSAADLFRERDTQFRATLASYGGTPDDDEPPMPPKTCVTCDTPYVGDTCYFCPPPAPKGDDAP